MYNDNRIYFYEPQKSIPYIKEKLQNCKDGKERGQLILLMCKSCIVNNDKDALSKVLDYVLIRYRNDMPALSVFFDKFMRFLRFTNLDDDCWKKIVDISKIFEISRPGYNRDAFFQKYFRYLIRNNKPFSECNKQRLEHILTTYSYVNPFAFFLDLSKYEKVFLEDVGQYIHLYKTHENYHVVCLSFLKQVYCFNVQNKRNPIDLRNFSALFDQLETDVYHGCDDIINYGLKYYPTDEIWHDLFLKRFMWIQDKKMLRWYVQKWPQKVLDKLDKILSNLGKSEKIFLKQLPKSDENSMEVVRAYAKSLLYSNEYKNVKLAISIFCIIAPERLLEIASSSIEKLESNIQLPDTELMMAKLAIKRLHKIENPYDTLQLVSRCCNRNFANCAIIPFCSVAYNIPEVFMVDELPKFTDKALCIRKTVLSLSKLILSSTDFAKIIEIFNEKETVATMKRLILQRSFESLNENPSEFFWNFTKKCILTVDDSDDEMYDSLMKLTNVPEEYLFAYIPLIYDTLSKNSHLEIQKKKYKLLESIPTQSITDLNIEFLKKIIKETAILKSVNNLHWNCILSMEGTQQEELFDENFKALERFIEESRHALNKSYDINVIITCYVSRFFDTVLNSKHPYILIEKFIVLWNSRMRLYSSHHIFLLVLFAEIYAKSDGDSYKTGAEIKTLLTQYIVNIGNSIITSISDQLNTFLIKTKMTEQDELLRFIQGFLENNDDENMYLIILNILSKNPPKYQNFDSYKDILQVIQKSTIPAVKLSLEIYLEEFHEEPNDDDNPFLLFC